MASTYLTRTFSTNGNRKKFTVSVWVKKSQFASGKAIWGSDDGSGYVWLIFGSTLYFQQNPSNSIEFNSTAKYRDVNGWYHIVQQVDTAQATASNRMKFWINGEQVTSWSTATYPSQNSDLNFTSSSEPIQIGMYGSAYWDGSMSHFHWCDGYAYDASDFGETDSTTGEWKIKTSPSVSYGSNGFFILKDGNSVTDQSGNTNNFTVAGGTLTKTEDNPSNVFATLNPLDVSAGTPAGLINGNNTYNKTATGAGTNGARLATIAPSSGKWYWEFKPADSVALILGFARTDHLNNTASLNGWIGQDVGAFGLVNGGDKIIAGSQTSESYGWTTNDIIGFAMDLDNHKFYAHKNGTYYNSGDPTSGATGTGAIGNITTGNNYAPWVQNNNYNATNVVHCNFGNGYFGTTAVSSAGTNASGIGIFEYDVPTGYTALSTKGLNE